MIWNLDKSACFEGYFLTHVSKYQLQITWPSISTVGQTAVTEITLLKVDNILNVTRSQMVDGDSYLVSTIASLVTLSSHWSAGARCWLVIGCKCHFSPLPFLWSGHVCYIICHDIHDAMLMPTNCSEPVTRFCHNQMVQDLSKNQKLLLVEFTSEHKLTLKTILHNQHQFCDAERGICEN